MYDDTVSVATDGRATLAIDAMIAPKIEPEITVRLAAPLPAGLTDPVEVLRHVEWLALARRLLSNADEERRGGSRGRRQERAAQPGAVPGGAGLARGRASLAPLGAGDLVSTGTMTESQLMARGEVWTAHLDGLPLRALAIDS